MAKSRASIIWMVNVVSFVLFSLLTSTGLINWLILPRGREAGSGVLISMRHFVREVHEWTALIFIVFIIIHLFLHWGYIKTQLKKML